MVSSIKGGAGPRPTTTSPQQQTNTAPKSDGAREQQRTGFRALSSGLAVQTAASSEARASGGKEAGKGDFKSVLEGLNDAISFSKKALEALGQIEEEVSGAGDAGAQQINNEVVKLREDIDRTLSRLQDGAATAEIIRENLISSRTRPEDLDAALALAQDTSQAIQQDEGKAAIEAHSGLDPSRVADLLAE